MRTRIPCRAVFLDAGGVIVLPDRHLLAGALARAGIAIDPDTVPRAHYRAVRALDRALERALERALGPGAGATRADYPQALIPQLGIVPGRTAEALAVWEHLADRRRAGAVLWREPTPNAARTIVALQRAGLHVFVVTNSDGHGEENLRACDFQLPVIDSTAVGAAKPDPHIFHIALERAGVEPAEAVHVGDTLANDVAGAQAAGISPIHFDPLRACRARDHRHIRSLPGLWSHIGTPTGQRSPPCRPLRPT